MQHLRGSRPTVRTAEQPPRRVPFGRVPGRQVIGEEDGERALARPVRSHQAPGAVALRTLKTVVDLGQGLVGGRREHVALQGAPRPRVALQVHRALKAAAHVDEVQKRLRTGRRSHAQSPFPPDR